VIDGPRGCRPDELPGVIELVDAAMRDGSDQTLRTDYPLVYAVDNLPNVQVVSVDGRVVATAPVLPRRVVGDGFAFGMGVISPTATDPGHRHRGYGSACVRGCIGRMADLRLPVSVLWTRVETFPFYELVGYQAVARSGATYRLDSTDAGRFAGDAGTIAVLADAPERFPEVRRLHERRGPRVDRTEEESAMLLSLPRMTTWLAIADGSVAAYLVESHASNKPGLIESGGRPSAVAALVRHVLGRLPPGATIDLPVGFAPDPLDTVAAEALADASPTPSDGDMMVRLNDPAEFLRSIRSWLGRRKDVIDGSVSIGLTDLDGLVSFEPGASGLEIGSRRHPRHVDLSRRELTSVVFGAHPARPVPVPAELAWIPPFTIPIPILDRS
jgi:predicted N-acetyltransferase YhbS